MGQGQKSRCQSWKESIQNCRHCIEDTNDLEDMGQSFMLLHVTHPPTLEIIFDKYGKNPSRTLHTVEPTRQDVPYFSSFIAKSWLNNLEHIDQGQKTLCMTHSLMLVIICANLVRIHTELHML